MSSSGTHASIRRSCLALILSLASSLWLGADRALSHGCQPPDAETLSPDQLASKEIFQKISILRQRLRTASFEATMSIESTEQGHRIESRRIDLDWQFDGANQLMVLDRRLLFQLNAGDHETTFDVRSLGFGEMRRPPAGTPLSLAMQATDKQIQHSRCAISRSEDASRVTLECIEDRRRTIWEVDVANGYTVIGRNLTTGHWNEDRQTFEAESSLENSVIHWDRIEDVWVPIKCDSTFTMIYKPFGPPSEPERTRITNLSMEFKWKSINQPTMIDPDDFKQVDLNDALGEVP